jgi:short-subunit dehydrogenase
MSALQEATARKGSLGIHRGGAALVTGASSGIGAAFAEALAGRGVDVLLTALPRESERLDAIAGDLGDRHGVRCVTLATDLASRDGPAELQEAADELEFDPDLVVNSAGLGHAGRFSKAPLDEQTHMLHVNVEALVRLTGLYLPRMVKRGAGSVINVASTAAFQPMPYFAVYAASKAFVLSFGEALWAEHREAGVRVVTVCSGPVETAFHGRPGETSEEEGVKGFLRRRYMTPERVAETGLKAVERDEPLVVVRMPGVGLLYHPVAMARGLVPVRARLKASERMHRWYFDEKHPS